MPPPRVWAIPYNKSFLSHIHPVGSVTLETLIQSPSQKEKKKPLSNQWYKACNWWEVKQRTMGNSVYSLNHCLSWRSSTTWDSPAATGWLDIFLASKPLDSGSQWLDGFSCRGMGQGNPGMHTGRCAKHAPISLCSSLPLPHCPIPRPTLHILSAPQEKRKHNHLLPCLRSKPVVVWEIRIFFFTHSILVS